MQPSRLGRLLYLCLIANLGGSVLVVVEVPQLVVAGASATLSCRYDLQGERLYAVKWYHRMREFFRYTPEALPPANIFPTPGIHVDILRSSANQVRLQNVDASLTGEFMCEVSADAPTFNTASDAATLIVSEIKLRKPLLHVSSSVYIPSTKMDINCSAQPTVPPPTITFFIDNRPVEEWWVRQESEYVAVMEAGALEERLAEATAAPQVMGAESQPTSATESSLPPEPLFRVRCEASLPGVYALSSASVPVILINPPSSGLDWGRETASVWHILFLLAIIALL